MKLIDRSAGVLTSLSRVLDRARKVLGARDPSAARLLDQASKSLGDAAAGLAKLTADPDGAHAAQALSNALKPVRRAIDEALHHPILENASLDDVITGLATSAPQGRAGEQNSAPFKRGRATPGGPPDERQSKAFKGPPRNLTHVTNPLSNRGIFVQIRWMHCNKSNKFQCCQYPAVIRILPEGSNSSKGDRLYL